jgi:hypothetical protein
VGTACNRALFRSHSNGIEAQARTRCLFKIRNGKMERICLYQDKQEALEAAGLRE